MQNLITWELRNEKKTFNILSIFFTIGKNLSKKVMSPKEPTVTDLLKPQNPGKVVILAESTIYMSTNLPPCTDS